MLVSLACRSSPRRAFRSSFAVSVHHSGASKGPRLLVRAHGSHSHDHAHTHGALKVGFASAGQRITLLGLLSNVVLTAGKVWAGLYYGSAALVADGLHSLSDMASDIVTLAALRIAARPPSPRFPGKDGLAKVEPLGALLVSGLLVVGGGSVGWSSLVKAASMLGFDLHSSHGHDHGSALLEHAHQLPLAAVGIAVGVIAVKEALYQATMAVARREESTLLRHGITAAMRCRLVRAKLFTKQAHTKVVIAVCAVGGSAAGIPAADPLGGVLVSLFVARAGLSTLRSSIYSLLDAQDPELSERVAKELDSRLSLLTVRRLRGVLEIHAKLTISLDESVASAMNEVAAMEAQLSQTLDSAVKLTCRVEQMELQKR